MNKPTRQHNTCACRTADQKFSSGHRSKASNFVVMLKLLGVAHLCTHDHPPRREDRYSILESTHSQPFKLLRVSCRTTCSPVSRPAGAAQFALFISLSHPAHAPAIYSPEPADIWSRRKGNRRDAAGFIFCATGCRSISSLDWTASAYFTAPLLALARTLRLVAVAAARRKKQRYKD